MLKKLFIMLFVGFIASLGCKETEVPPTPPPPPEPTCDDTKLPIVFAHGFLGSGDTYTNPFLLFTSNGYCGDRIFAYDWNSLDNALNQDSLLDLFVDRVLAETSASQINLAGHSAGGSLGYSYLSDVNRAAKVANYVHIGSGPQAQPAGPSGEVPTLNIWSNGDMVVAGADIPGATNLELNGLDHYEVATIIQSFVAMYEFFNNGESPATQVIEEDDDVTVSGKVLTFGENQPNVGATINIYQLNPETGQRLNEKPDGVLDADADGNWGPFTVVPEAPYEFLVEGVNVDDRPVIYYREGFLKSNKLVYLRTLPSPGSIAGLLVAALPQDDNQTALAVFSSSQAVIADRDALFVDGVDLAIPEFASADQTTIAYFLYDDDGDGQTSGNAITLFTLSPFIAGVDLFIPTAPPASVEIEFNGRKMYVRNWRSETDGVVVAVFD
ncbi:MAG: hypothetical protein AAF502_22610 [Bacteroidota bacterium]